MASSPGVETLLDLMLSPGLWLSVGLVLVYGALFYMWRGGGLRQLGRDLLAGIIGFGLGQAAGNQLRVNAFVLGQVNLLAGTLGAGLGLLVGRWLGRRRAGK
jgi:hypothetical protein